MLTKLQIEYHYLRNHNHKNDWQVFRLAELEYLFKSTANIINANNGTITLTEMRLKRKQLITEYIKANKQYLASFIPQLDN